MGVDGANNINVGPMSNFEGKKTVEPAAENPTASVLAVNICNLVKNWLVNHSKLDITRYPSFKGFWRHIHIKENLKGEFILSFRFNNYNDYELLWKEERGSFIRYILNHSSTLGYYLKGIYYQKCCGTAEPSRKDVFYKLYYEGELIENILGYNFVINPGCFFQVNTKIARILYSIVQSFYKNDKGEILLDLCCGVGIFGILMSKYFRNVIGIDNNPCNSEMVKRNCELNNVKNYTYFEGNVEDSLGKILTDDKVCSIVLNPPRRGLYEKFIEYINSKKKFVKDMVYVSCNMESLKRDMDHFGEGWKIEKVIPLDQFPDTVHCEIIVKMKNKMF